MIQIQQRRFSFYQDEDASAKIFCISRNLKPKLSQMVIQNSMHWLLKKIQTPFKVCFLLVKSAYPYTTVYWHTVLFPFFHSIIQLRVLFCAVAMDNTPKEPVCATVAGKGQSVTYPSASVLIRHAEAMVLALKGTVFAL